MHNIPRLDRAARRRLIRCAKKAKDPNTALRYLMVAKLGQGLSRHQVARDLACAPSTVVKAGRRFADAGEKGLRDQRAFNGAPKVDVRFKEELKRVLHSVPTEPGVDGARAPTRCRLHHGPRPLGDRRTARNA